MKNYAFLTLFIICSQCLLAQTSTRNIGNYTELKVSGSISVELVKQSAPEAKITMIKGDDNQLVTELEGSKLKIYFKKGKMGNWDTGEKAKITLGFNQLNAIKTAAGSVVKGIDKVSTSSMIVDASSGSIINVCIDAKECKADASSGASLSLEGVTTQLKVDASSGAVINAQDLTAQNVDAGASSGAAIKVHARESISANASSGGAIRYKGEPVQKDIDAGNWSGGSISKI